MSRNSNIFSFALLTEHYMGFGGIILEGEYSYEALPLFTPLESPAIYSGVDSKSLVVSRSEMVNSAGQRDKFERGLKPRSNFLTEFTFICKVE